MNTVRTSQGYPVRLFVSRMLAMVVASLPMHTALAQTAQATRHAPAASFTLVANGETMGTFRRISMLNDTANVVEERESGSETAKRHTGKSQPGKIILSEGDPQSEKNISMWYQEVRQGNLVKARRNATLTLRASDGKQVARYELKGAWPAKVTMGTPGAKNNSAGIETLELEYESIERVE